LTTKGNIKEELKPLRWKPTGEGEEPLNGIVYKYERGELSTGFRYERIKKSTF
jgi:hypothetical protein